MNDSYDGFMQMNNMKRDRTNTVLHPARSQGDNNQDMMQTAMTQQPRMMHQYSADKNQQQYKQS